MYHLKWYIYVLDFGVHIYNGSLYYNAVLTISIKLIVTSPKHCDSGK